MKKLFFIAVCTFCIFTASAQSTSSTSYRAYSGKSDSPSVRFGIRGGINLAVVSGDFDDAIDSRTAYHIGVVADIPLVQELYIQTGLYLQSKGAKYEIVRGKIESKETINALYLQVPVLLSYNYGFSGAFQLQVNFGPYFAYGVGGKYKGEERKGNEFYGIELDTFGNKGLFKNFDCGLQVGGGMTFARHYYFGLTYEFGLITITKAKDAEVKSKNRNWMISLGYTF